MLLGFKTRTCEIINDTFESGTVYKRKIQIADDTFVG